MIVPLWSWSGSRNFYTLNHESPCSICNPGKTPVQVSHESQACVLRLRAVGCSLHRGEGRSVRCLTSTIRLDNFLCFEAQLVREGGPAQAPIAFRTLLKRVGKVSRIA